MDYPTESQITSRASGHILTNTNVWSPDGKWLVYDTRSDAAGDKFDGSTIEIVNVDSGEVREIYRSQNHANCGVATFAPIGQRVVFILGPQHPTHDWQYGPTHRQGMMIDIDRPGFAVNLDARDLLPPCTPGALRGGTHVHVFEGTGTLVSFTYDDHILATLDAADACGTHERNQRNVGVSVLGKAVDTCADHPRNHHGTAFSVLVTQTVNQPRPGSDEISRAFEEGWVGTRGYVLLNGSQQRYALAFQGKVTTRNESQISEVYIVDLPEDLTQAGDRPLQGRPTTRPAPPRGTRQRRLTYTADRKHPGLQGPRHWLRSSPDGSMIAFLMRDDDGIVQIWTVSPNGGDPRQVTHNKWDVASAFSWCPIGRRIGYISDGSVFTTDVSSGATKRLTDSDRGLSAPRPEACVFAPDGSRIAFVRPIAFEGQMFNQLFTVTAPE